VAQQVPDRDRPAERFEQQRRAFARFLDTDFHIGKGRDVFCQGIVERKPAVLDQHHRRDRGHRLRHRIKPEDAVRGHRQPCHHIAHAEILEIDRLAVLLDQQHGAGNFSGCNLVAEVVANTIKRRA